MAIEIHRREEYPAIGHGIVPIPIDINISAAAPAIARGHPGPVGAQRQPVTGPPNIAGVGPGPVARNPTLIIRWRRDIGTNVEVAGRRRGDVGHLGARRIGPIAGGPLVLSIADPAPVAGEPLPTGGQIAPDATDPQEIGLLIVPPPVARDPSDVVAHGLLFGRHFFDRFGRFGPHDEPRLRIEAHRFRKRLMDGAAGEDLHVCHGG